MLSALAPRLLRVAGELTDGTILWMANARSIETHVAPQINAAATAAGRPAPRIVAGLPVAVHDDVAEARDTAAKNFAGYGVLPNYRRILDIGGAPGPADAAIVGDEGGGDRADPGLFDAGATDVWAAPFPVGDDRSASRKRTRAAAQGTSRRSERLGEVDCRQNRKQETSTAGTARARHRVRAGVAGAWYADAPTRWRRSR